MQEQAIYDRISLYAQEKLDNRRFLHTLGVAQAAVVLAQANGVNSQKAAIVALLHDCAKGLSQDELARILASPCEYLQPTDYDFPKVLHAPAAAVIASTVFEINDPEILEAIAYHPTGAADPSPLLQVLMAADFTEPSRDYPGVEAGRRLVREDLQQGLRWIIGSKIGHLRSTGRAVHPRALAMAASIGTQV